MVGTFERRLCTQAWATSVLLHGLVVAIVALLASQIKPLPIQEVFQWHVSLVEPMPKRVTEPRSEVAQSLRPIPQGAQVRPMRSVSTSRAEVRQVQTSEPSLVVTEEQRQQAQHVTQLQRKLSLVHQHEAVLSPMSASLNESTSRQESEPTTQSLERMAVSVVALVASTEQSTDLRTSASTALASSTLEKIDQTVEARGGDLTPQGASLPKDPITPTQLAESAQSTAKTMQQLPTRAVYGWLIESLSARLAELKSYPTAARTSGLEGKVLLRAVIRADGYLAEVSVQKSSGHEELDVATMQTMRDASPMHLRHALGRAQIALTIPLVYKLAN